MKALPDNPSKAQEIEHFRAFMKSLPADSYLRNMFGGMETYVEQQIQDDFGWNIREAMTRKDEELSKMGRIRDDALVQVQNLEAQVRKADEMNMVIRGDVERFRADKETLHEALVAMTNQAADLREARAAYLMEMDRLLADFVALRQQIKGA